MNSDPVWVNGRLGGWIDPRDRGLTLGDGVFDTLAAFRRVPFAGERHLGRLRDQAAAIGIAIDLAAIRAGWKSVLAAAGAEHLVLRTTVTRGVAPRGLWSAAPVTPTLVVSATPWGPASFSAPVRLVTSTITRDPSAASSRLKSLGYLDNIMAAREAAAASADDALMLTPAGRVACATIANVFAIEARRLLTPPVGEGAMPGIMRALVLDAARSSGLDPVEQPLSPDDLRRADAVFLTNSVRFLLPALSLDGRTLRSDGVEAVTRLRDAIAEKVRAECCCDPRMLR